MAIFPIAGELLCHSHKKCVDRLTLQQRKEWERKGKEMVSQYLINYKQNSESNNADTPPVELVASVSYSDTNQLA
jgi:hypothetical protein